ncbi:MAG: hypothetical protein ACI32N_05275 [Bulleidia sp.]
MKTKLKHGNSQLIVMIGEAEIVCDSSVLYVYDFDWNRYLSPWPCERVFSNGNDFEGKADDFLNELLETVSALEYEKTVIAGYSLAGLFSLYACVNTNVFDGCVCCSGSLWYPEFVSYVTAHPVQCDHVYLSLGNREKNTKNRLLRNVETCSLEVYRILQKQCDTFFAYNEGTHSDDITGRLKKGIEWMETVL